MENKIYNDDVELIVNDPERQEAIEAFHQKRKVNRQKKMFDNAVIFCVIALAFAILGALGLMVDWIVCPAFAVCVALAAFYFGRFFENGKVYGWY
jgi:1,4-dihydroxy-2-naphthoate octaprenyltransferase